MKNFIILFLSFQFCTNIFNSEISNVLKNLKLNCQASCFLVSKKMKTSCLNEFTDIDLLEFIEYLSKKNLPQNIECEKVDQELEALIKEWNILLDVFESMLIKIPEDIQKKLYKQKLQSIKNIRKIVEQYLKIRLEIKL